MVEVAGVRVLATSRVTLQVPGEHVRVPAQHRLDLARLDAEAAHLDLSVQPIQVLQECERARVRKCES